jgi:AcrR family transcriptional regulator
MTAERRATAPGSGSARGPDQAAGPGRREQILQAAQRLFADQGFRETNLGDVAAQLGFRRQAVYHYFRSKDEILYELIDRAGRALVAAAEPTLQGGLPPADMLAEVVRSHVRQLLADADVFRIQFTELSKLTGERADQLRRDIWAYVRRIAAVIEAGQRDGSFTGDVPPVTQALLIVGMCNGTTEWYSSARSGLSIDEVADHAARTALTGVTATAAAGR